MTLEKELVIFLTSSEIETDGFDAREVMEMLEFMFTMAIIALIFVAATALVALVAGGIMKLKHTASKDETHKVSPE